MANVTDQRTLELRPHNFDLTKKSRPEFQSTLNPIVGTNPFFDEFSQLPRGS